MPEPQPTPPLPRSALPLELQAAKVAAARLSIFSNAILTAGKLAVGLASGSVSVLSEAAHSAGDLIASWIAFVSVRVADRPADENHPYGHGKIESLSGLAEGLLIFGAAAAIIFEAGRKLIYGLGPANVDWPLAIMVVSIVLNSIVAARLFRVARETHSLALEADAEHLRSDVYTSAGVIVGLVLVRVTGISLFDPLAALIVAGMIMRASWKISRTALDLLMDVQLPEDELEIVRRILASQPEVLGYHKLRTRKSGAQRYIDAHILMEDELTLVESHNRTEQIEDMIRAAIKHAEVTLHTEPYHQEQLHQHEEHGGPVPDRLLEPVRPAPTSPSGP